MSEQMVTLPREDKLKPRKRMISRRNFKDFRDLSEDKRSKSMPSIKTLKNGNRRRTKIVLLKLSIIRRRF